MLTSDPTVGTAFLYALTPLPRPAHPGQESQDGGEQSSDSDSDSADSETESDVTRESSSNRHRGPVWQLYCSNHAGEWD